MTLRITVLSAKRYYTESRVFYCYAECHYAGCRYTECRGAIFILFLKVHSFIQMMQNFVRNFTISQTSHLVKSTLRTGPFNIGVLFCPNARIISKDGVVRSNRT